jgi:hypothetical protein
MGDEPSQRESAARASACHDGPSSRRHDAASQPRIAAPGAPGGSLGSTGSSAEGEVFEVRARGPQSLPACKDRVITVRHVARFRPAQRRVRPTECAVRADDGPS